MRRWHWQGIYLLQWRALGNDQLLWLSLNIHLRTNLNEVSASNNSRKASERVGDTLNNSSNRSWHNRTQQNEHTPPWQQQPCYVATNTLTAGLKTSEIMGKSAGGRREATGGRIIWTRDVSDAEPQVVAPSHTVGSTLRKCGWCVDDWCSFAAILGKV
jgi:hypothetical protein